MKTYFKAASWDLLLVSFTIGANILAVVSIYFTPTIITLGIMGGLIVLPPFFMIRGYSIDGSTLIIHRLGWTKEFDLKDLRKVEFKADAIKGSWRRFGNGGLYGWIGKFSNQELGTFRAYATNRNKCVVLYLREETLLLTPEDPVSFKDYVQNIELKAHV